jgi:hypothetical protein
MPRQADLLGHGTGCGEDMGRVARGCNPLHLPLLLMSWRMRIIRLTVEGVVLPVFHARQHGCLGAAEYATG